MFHKQYYRLEEAAQKLGVDVETLLHSAIRKELSISIEQKRFGSVLAYDLNSVFDCDRRRYAESLDDDHLLDSAFDESGLVLHLDPMQLINFLFHGQDKILSSENEDFLSSIALKSTSESVAVVYVEDNERNIHLHDLVITHTELNRLLALKAEQDGKPTVEQLQQKLDEANLRIAELEAMHAQAICEISPKSKAPIAATFKAIKDIYPELTIDNILNQTELNGTPVSRAAIAKYLSGNF